jgi:hypothetical protein
MANASSSGTRGSSVAAARTPAKSPLRSARRKIEYADPWEVKQAHPAAAIASNRCSHIPPVTVRLQEGSTTTRPSATHARIPRTAGDGSGQQADRPPSRRRGGQIRADLKSLASFSRPRWPRPRASVRAFRSSFSGRAHGDRRTRGGAGPRGRPLPFARPLTWESGAGMRRRAGGSRTSTRSTLSRRGRPDHGRMGHRGHP